MRIGVVGSAAGTIQPPYPKPLRVPAAPGFCAR